MSNVIPSIIKVQDVISIIFNGQDMRFVRSPLAGIDTPWVVASDVVRALGCSDDDVAGLLRGLRQASPMRSAAVSGVIMQIVPAWVLMLAAEMVPLPHSGASKAVIEAFRRFYPDLPPATRAMALFSAPSACPTEE